MLIDTRFDFRNDTPAKKDPDSHSPTLRRYHKLLWSKVLPGGSLFDLRDDVRGAYLHHGSGIGTFSLSSDSAIPTFTRWGFAKAHPELYSDEENRAFMAIAYTIGGINHMVPWGGAEPMLGNNPFAVAFPLRGEAPLVLDMACSVAARGKIIVAAKEGVPIPEGWAVDRDGVPTTDARKALEGFVTPVGGPKGYALTLTIGLLSTMLSGAGFGSEVTHMYDDFERPQNIGHLFGALPIAAFEDLDTYYARMAKAAREVRSVRKAPGVDRISLPGEREAPNDAQLPAAHPEEAREHGEQQRPRRPVDLEPHEPREKRREPVQVRPDPTRIGPVDEHPMTKPDESGGHRHREKEHHHQMAEVLVVHDDVHGHRQYGEQHVVDELDSEKKLQIHIGLVAVPAAERLEQNAGAHQHRLQRGEHCNEREEPAEHRHPIGHRWTSVPRRYRIL